jgi:hypothetical protein
MAKRRKEARIVEAAEKLAAQLRRAPRDHVLQEDRDEFLAAMSPLPSREEIHDLVSGSNFVPDDIYQAGMAHAFNICGEDCFYREDKELANKYFDYAQELEERPKGSSLTTSYQDGKCTTCGSKPYGPSCPIKCDEY